MAEGGRFVGIGIDQYDDGGPPLDYPAAEVRAVARILQPTFTGSPLVNLAANDIRDQLDSIAATSTEQLVLLWAGHGVAKGEALWLRTKRGEILAAEVITRCVESGASQLLLLIDCCHAGQAMADVHRVATTLLTEFPPKSSRVWLGIIVSCRAGETARDGAFGHLLQRLLTEGPKSVEMRRRWSRHNRLIFGDDLGAALIEEWDDPDQQPMYLADGRRWFMVPNPLWDPDAPDVVIAHLLDAARGGGDADRSLFSGRRAEVDTVVEWVVERRPGIRVVTGSAGTGKTAIVGRVVSLSNPKEREGILRVGALGHRDPGERSVDAHVHARGLTADGAANLLDGQLSRVTTDQNDVGPTLLPAETGPRNAHELIGALQKAEKSGARVPVIVIDGVDEARDSAFDIAENLLAPLGEYSTLIVSTRDLARERAPYRLLEILGATATLDLNAPAQQASQREAIMEFATRELGGRNASMEARLIGEVLSDRVGDRDSFLRVRIAVSQLLSAPIDTSLPNWQEHLLQSVGQAFETDIARIAAAPEASLPEEPDLARLARILLVALTWGLGAGFPEDEWSAVASSIAGRRLHSRHIDWVCEHFGRYIVEDGEAGVAVYRIAHESLADYLRPTLQPTKDAPFDSGAKPVWDALNRRYRDVLGAGREASESTYLWRYAYRHAAATGVLGVNELESLADDFPALLPSAARAYSVVAQVFLDTDRNTEAIQSNRTAVSLYRVASMNHADLLPDLALALGELGVRLHEIGQDQEALQPAEEAVQIYDDLFETTALYDFGRAGALGNLGILYRSLGRLNDATTVMEEAVTISEGLTSPDQRDAAQLALSLLNLGMIYADGGRHAEALNATTRAVEIYRPSAESDPGKQGQLASALGHLAICLRNAGRLEESLALTHEVVEIYGHEPDAKTRLSGLAAALSNLGIGYGMIDRPHDALGYLTDAASRYQKLSSDDPRYLGDLASSLANLGLCRLTLGPVHEAIAALEESVSINRILAETTPTRQLRLAETAGVLMRIHFDRRAPADALAPAIESVAVYRQLANADDRFLRQLGPALDTLCAIYRALGRPAEGAAAAKEAVDVFRTLALNDARELPRLVWVLAMYSTCLHEMGCAREALDPAVEAVAMGRTLSADDPIHQRILAGALIDLGNAFRALQQLDDSLAATQEAVDVLSDAAADNVRDRVALATALGNLSLSLRDLGNSADAVAPSDQSASILRELSSSHPEYRAELARTLINVGALHIELQEPQAALDAFDEAIAINRAAGSDVPFRRFHLAGALGNRSSCLTMLGRFDEAAVAAEEAVELFREAFDANPGRLYELASALTILERALEPLSQSDRAERRWAEASEALADETQQARLWIARADDAAYGDHRAVSWLSKAIELSQDDRTCLAAAHESARRHRAPEPQSWDTEWERVTACLAPDWVSVDRELLTAAQTWASIHAAQRETAQRELLETARDFLAAHHKLLTAAADVAVGEALLALDAALAQRIQNIRSEAATSGVATAYRPVLTEALLDKFETASPREQRVLLGENKADLTAAAALDDVHRREQEAGVDVAARRAYAVLKLAACEGSDRVLDRIFMALDDPSLISVALRAIALDPAAAVMLPLAAVVGQTATNDPATVGTAHIYAAIACAMIQQSAGSEDYVHLALATAPNSRDTFILLVADVGTTVPAALEVVRYLVSGPIRTEAG